MSMQITTIDAHRNLHELHRHKVQANDVIAVTNERNDKKKCVVVNRTATESGEFD